MHEVIICEKPKASEKISTALPGTVVKKNYRKVPYYEVDDGNGKKTTVLAAVGHLYSLTPINRKKKKFDLEWVPLYEKDKSKKYTKNYVDAIKKLAKDADKFVHACDYDIEGTLIGYNALKYACGDESLKNTVRMKFSTLTDEDILDAYENPIDLDINQVDSGIARHVLDFIFGVNISKYLTDSVMNSTKRYIQLSAGRVQTPTLAILVERQKEIDKFIPEPYWTIKAHLEGDIIADHRKGKIFNREDVDEILADCKDKDALVSKIDVKKSRKIPPFPFDLGSLQSEAYALFGFSPKKTQQIAQNLYTEGYTSYPRTSSQKLPKSIGYDKILEKLKRGNAAFRKSIDKLKTPYKPREGKKTDEAHPSIHPTGVIPKKLGRDYQKLYEIIAYRFISVFGEDAVVETMKTSLEIGDQIFSFTRKKTAELGWQSQYPFRSVENDEFPTIKEGETLKGEVKDEEKETKPPARYNQASLIRELEKRGLGTKSTRANIISILYDRKYVEGKKIEVNVLGEQLIDTLVKYSEKITSEELTREFEAKLENIQKGKTGKEKIIEEYKTEISSILDDIEKNKLKIGEELYNAYRESMIVGECKCGNNLIMISSRQGNPFIGCSGYPDCKNTYSLPKGAIILKSKCEECGLPMISFGKPRQRACLDPKCGKEDEEPSNEVVGECPECGSELIKRSGRYGEFVGCKGFPKCRYTKSMEETA